MGRPSCHEMKWATIRGPKAPKIDRAMIPKVPGYDKKTADEDAHRTPASTREMSPRSADVAGYLPLPGKSL
jgi:hypothetical protein